MADWWGGYLPDFDDLICDSVRSDLEELPKPRVTLLCMLGMGDNVRLIPVVQALAARYPDHSILVALKSHAEVYGAVDMAVRGRGCKILIDAYGHLSPAAETLLRAESAILGNVSRYLWETPGMRLEENARRQFARLRDYEFPYPALNSAKLVPVKHRGPRYFTVQNDSCWHGSMKEFSQRKAGLAVSLLKETTGYEAIQVGGERDRTIPGCDHYYHGRLSLLQSFWMISRAEFHLGSDTGLGHAAAALGTPTIQWYGPTEPEVVSDARRCNVWGNRRSCPVYWRTECPHVPKKKCPFARYDEDGCRAMPSVNAVVDAAIDYLKIPASIM